MLEERAAIGGQFPAGRYMFLRVALMLLRFLAAAFFLRSTLGGVNAIRRLVFEIKPSSCTRLLKRRRSCSKLSPSE